MKKEAIPFFSPNVTSGTLSQYVSGTFFQFKLCQIDYVMTSHCVTKHGAIL